MSVTRIDGETQTAMSFVSEPTRRSATRGRTLLVGARRWHAGNLGRWNESDTAVSVEAVERVGVGGSESVEGTVHGLASPIVFGRRLTGCLVMLTCVGLSLVAGTSHAGDDKGNKGVGPANPWQLVLRQQAKNYTVTLSTPDGPKSATLRPYPLTLWAQPVRGGDQGAVFLWTHESRPVLMGTLFLWPKETDEQTVLVNTHELRTLSNDEVRSTYLNRQWSAPVKSLIWRNFEGESVRVSGRRKQSLQIRQLMGQLSAVRTDSSGDQTHLRLLPKPLYVFPSNDPTADASRRSSQRSSQRGATPGETEVTASQEAPLAGSIWGFVDGTDLEVILLSEARLVDETFRWQFSAARMSDRPLKVLLNDKPKWAVGRSRHADRSSPYFISHVDRLDPISGDPL